MTTSTRQIELSLTSLARSFRRALRIAEKTDPMGNPETSAVWKTVAHRQAQFQNMLETAHRFFHPQSAAQSAAQPAQEPAPETAQEMPDDLPPQILATQRKITATLERPAATAREQRRQTHDLGHLRNLLQNQLRAHDRRRDQAGQSATPPSPPPSSRGGGAAGAG